VHEEVFRGVLSEAVGHFQQPKGEFTIVIDGSRQEPKAQLTADVEDEMAALQRQGVPAKEAIARLAAITGLPRKELYQSWLELKHDE
jgi:16S rRNA (cytidine1402-2'-O)-methyltransferase